MLLTSFCSLKYTIIIKELILNMACWYLCPFLSSLYCYLVNVTATFSVYMQNAMGSMITKVSHGLWNFEVMKFFMWFIF